MVGTRQKGTDDAADHGGRRGGHEHLNVGRAGCSLASRPLNECEPLQIPSECSRQTEMGASGSPMSRGECVRGVLDIIPRRPIANAQLFADLMYRDTLSIERRNALLDVLGKWGPGDPLPLGFSSGHSRFHPLTDQDAFELC